MVSLRWIKLSWSECMGYFENVVRAAIKQDIWTLETIHRGDIFSHIDNHRKQLDLTPAGQLASDKNWEAVGFLYDNFQINPEGVIFGAVLGGQYEDVQLAIQNDLAESESLLAKICSEYYQAYLKDENKKKSCHLNPIAKALEIRKNSVEVDTLLDQFTFKERCENGLLEAAVIGAAYVGNDDRVFALLNCLENESLNIDDTVKLSKRMELIEQSALKAAAEGGYKKLVNKLLRWCSDKFSTRNLDSEEPLKSTFMKDVITKALTGAARAGHMELINDLIPQYNNTMPYMIFKHVPKEMIEAACQTQQFAVLESLIKAYPRAKDDARMTLAKFDVSGESAHSMVMCSWSYSNGLLDWDEDKLEQMICWHIRLQNQTSGYDSVIRFVSGIDNLSLRNMFRASLIKYFDNDSNRLFAQSVKEEKRALDDVRKMQDLQSRYCLLWGHALLFIQNPELLDAIVKNDLTNDQKVELRLLLGTPVVEVLIKRIQDNQPRAQFIATVEKYLEDYDKSYKMHHNHAERARSVLNSIKADTSDEEFKYLIDQQKRLLEGKKANIVLGSDEDKHNQVATRRMMGDKFTAAVFKCNEQLHEAKSQEQEHSDEYDTSDEFSLF